MSGGGTSTDWPNPEEMTHNQRIEYIHSLHDRMDRAVAELGNQAPEPSPEFDADDQAVLSILVAGRSYNARILENQYWRRTEIDDRDAIVTRVNALLDSRYFAQVGGDTYRFRGLEAGDRR